MRPVYLGQGDHVLAAAIAKSSGGRICEHFAYEMDRILCAELLHDVGAVKFDRARTDTERAGGLFAGGPRDDLRQRHALARRQQLIAWKWLREDVERAAQLLDLLLCLLELRRFQEFPLTLSPRMES